MEIENECCRTLTDYRFVCFSWLWVLLSVPVQLERFVSDIYVSDVALNVTRILTQFWNWRSTSTLCLKTFNTIVWWRKLDEVRSECTSHNFSLFAIFLSKIIKIGGNLTKFWQKQFCTVFLRHGVYLCVCGMCLYCQMCPRPWTACSSFPMPTDCRTSLLLTVTWLFFLFCAAYETEDHVIIE